MNEKKKKIIYFGLMLLLAVAFISLYLLDGNVAKSEGKDAFSSLIEAIEPTINDNQADDTQTIEPQEIETSEYGKSYLKSDRIQIVNWDKSKVDSIQVFSPRNKFTLINQGRNSWSVRSVRIQENIPKTNRALFRLLNMFDHLYTDNNLTKDYSEYAEYFENPYCKVIVNFNDGTTKQMTFIGIEEYDDFSQKVIMKYWTRVNEETVVYAILFNSLERFLVSENEFLKIY